MNAFRHATALALALAAPSLGGAAEAERADLSKTWANAGFNHPEVTPLSRAELNPGNAGSRATHGFRLTAVVFRETGWSAADVRTRLQRVSAIYARCGVALTEATLVLADAPNGWIDISGRDGDRDGGADNDNAMRMAEMLPSAERPVIFYVRSSRDGRTALSYARYYVTGNPPGLNTAWITAEVASAGYRQLHDPSYLPDAHELGHLLLDRGHVDDGSINLMAGAADLVNDQLTPEQCTHLKASGMVRPL